MRQLLERLVAGVRCGAAAAAITSAIAAPITAQQVATPYAHSRIDSPAPESQERLAQRDVAQRKANDASYQSAPFPGTPGGLRWFGYSGGCDDDAAIAQTRPTTNLCVVDVTDPRLSDPKWTARLALQGVRLGITVQNTFFVQNAPPTPDGYHYGLRSDYITRWNAAIAGKESVIAGATDWFYVADEPNWNHMSRADIVTEIALIKKSFPAAKSATSLANVQLAPWIAGLQGADIPTDLVGYHHYGVRDPRTDAQYQSDVALIKSRANGKDFLYILDAFWSSDLQGTAGIALSDMGTVADNYYAMAAADPDAVALVGFQWPSGPGITGARDMPADVRYEHRRIGAAIAHKCLAPSFVDTPQQALFFQGCRFMATVEYTHPTLGEQMMSVTPQSDVFSEFWFTDEGNIEGGMKLLDGHVVNNDWWLFFSGNTTLPVHARLYDLHDGNRLVWEHTHPGGAKPPAINDTLPWTP